MEEFIKLARRFVYKECEKTKTPSWPIVVLSCEVGKRLAKTLNANVEIVEAGTILMDCMLGQAKIEGRQAEHVQISLEKTNELLEKSDLDEKTKENIRHCVFEHHGVKRFYSLESEICCNADCYRFVSIKGFVLNMRGFEGMPLGELIKLLKMKFEEKSNALSLEICKNELRDEMKIIRGIFQKLDKKTI
jgi:hypothetical protein